MGNDATVAKITNRSELPRFVPPTNRTVVNTSHNMFSFLVNFSYGGGYRLKGKGIDRRGKSSRVPLIPVLQRSREPSVHTQSSRERESLDLGLGLVLVLVLGRRATVEISISFGGTSEIVCTALS